MEIEITVIVPIFNSHKTLKKLFESLEKQTFRNFKVILVDGGSTDGSLDLCKAEEQNDQHFSVIDSKQTTEKHDVATLRNLGINEANSKYLTFIDSDDWVDSDHLFTLIDNINETELSVCGWTHADKRLVKKTNTTMLASRENLLIKTLGMKESAGYVVNKLFLTEIIKKNNLKFKSNYEISEDLFFSIQYINKINYGILIKPAKTYHYIQREGSATNTLYSKKPFAELDTVNDIEGLIDGFDVTVRNAYLVHKMMAYNSIFRVEDDNKLLNRFVIHARSEVKQNLSIIIKSREYSSRSKVILVGFSFFPDIIRFCRRLKRKFL